MKSEEYMHKKRKDLQKVNADGCGPAAGEGRIYGNARAKCV